MASKYVYFFGRKGDKDFTEGKKELKSELGGKGANLAEMTRLGLPIPPGFTISAASQKHWVDNDETKKEILKQYKEKLTQLEEFHGQKLGNTLLVSVRSGAAVSMPGMMDTVLNLGIHDAVMDTLVKKFEGKERFVWDSYRRFIQMFANIAMGIDLEHFEKVLEGIRKEYKVEFDKDIPVEGLKKCVEKYKQVFKETAKRDFPQDPYEQLEIAVSAVFGSWYNERAIHYRKMNKIDPDLCPGTAVNVQTMVFGNMNEKSGTGVAFSRDPATGEKKLFGEFLINAQGEDVVAGIRTPLKIKEMEKAFPKGYKFLVECCAKLEKHYKAVQDMEFTIQENEFYFLQTRNGKMTGHAMAKVLVDMVEEGLITKKEAIMDTKTEYIDHFLHPAFEPKALKAAKPIGKGIAASPGASVGCIVFNNEMAVEFQKKKVKCILARQVTSPEDLIGMEAAAGILTSTGGRTSHAAVVARGMGKCCVCGCGEAIINEEKETIEIGGEILKKGDYISLDGSTGNIYKGKIETMPPTLPNNFKKLLEWEKEFRKMGVWTNADTPKDALKAVEFGAEGIGLVRTEHMFFEKTRIKVMREMILASKDKKSEPLKKLKPFQVDDFYGIFKAMNGKPVTIRLLDPPLHEFLPKFEQIEEIKEIASELNIAEEEVKKRILEMHEHNPMLGHRGCRLGITFPEITIMQAQAIYEAAFKCLKEGRKVKVEIMIPLINSPEEYIHQKNLIEAEYIKYSKLNPDVKLVKSIGTMIEIPRAAILAGEVVEQCDFFSFGTNDLTQMTLGFSRDDAKDFINEYINLGIMKVSPFEVIDEKGVGWLVQHTVNEARKKKPKFKMGICGEHGGNPQSVDFCYRAGLSYVSCSPFRVLVARVAAAQASIKHGIRDFQK